MTKIEHEKVSDAILKETISVEPGFGWSDNYIMKLFDFESEQITTFVNRSNSDTAPNVVIQNFDHIQGKAAIKRAFNKLVELGGNPPDLNLDEKKPQSLRSIKP